MSVKARPHFGVFSSTPASGIAAFEWELNSAAIWKSSGSTAINPLAGAVGITGTYGLDIDALCGYFCGANSPGSVTAVSTSTPAFSLGGTTALVDVLAVSAFAPIAITTSSAQTLSLLVNYKATGVKTATYVSGGTFTGTGNCTLGAFNDSSTATGSIAVSSGTPGAITITARGSGATAAPTSVAQVNTCTGGAAWTSGAITITSTLGGSPGNALIMYGMALTQ